MSVWCCGVALFLHLFIARARMRHFPYMSLRSSPLEIPNKGLYLKLFPRVCMVLTGLYTDGHDYLHCNSHTFVGYLWICACFFLQCWSQCNGRKISPFLTSHSWSSVRPRFCRSFSGSNVRIDVAIVYLAYSQRFFNNIENVFCLWKIRVPISFLLDSNQRKCSTTRPAGRSGLVSANKSLAKSQGQWQEINSGLESNSPGKRPQTVCFRKWRSK